MTEVFDVEFRVIWLDDELHVMLKLGHPELYAHIDGLWEARIEEDRYTKAECDNIGRSVESLLRQVGLRGDDKFQVVEVGRTLRT